MMVPIWVDSSASCITCDVAESIGKIHRPICGTVKSAFSKTWHFEVSNSSVKYQFEYQDMFKKSTEQFVEPDSPAT